MATLVLTSLVTASGLTGFGAIAAGVAASAVGGLIDNALIGSAQSSSTVPQDTFTSNTSTADGPRLAELSFSSSVEGGPVRRVFGRTRMGGNVIWAARMEERVYTYTQTSYDYNTIVTPGTGSKFNSTPSSSVTHTSENTTVTTTYDYRMSFAVAFCEGNARATMGRMWIDGELADTRDYNINFYPGSETQGIDPVIEGVEGVGTTPAFKGICYAVFENFPLEVSGGRMPQITLEINVPVEELAEDSLEGLLEGINMIPASGEVAYSTTPTVRSDGYGNSVPENIMQSAFDTNLEIAMENLSSELPNNKGVNLVVSWFGTDLRASHCEFVPKVELKEGRELNPYRWSVSGLERDDVNIQEVSTDADSNPAFGGTPADYSIVEAIKHMGDVNGQNVLFYPFLLMDIESGNTLPDTDTGASGQPTYPWRGRITTSLPSVDKTAAAQTEVDSLFGSVVASNFTVSGTTVTYTGSSSDNGYRRMILHYAHLCAAAANSMTDSSKFKAFYIGTELRGITQIRSTAAGTATASTVYPGVNALVELLEDVRAIFDAAGLSGVELSYAADWSEYHSHRPSDGSGDVYFNMDALWSHPDCDYVAIDNYLPMSDWRDGTDHKDYGTGTNTEHSTLGGYGSLGFAKGTSIYSKDYLAGQIEGGEYYHYYYASDADRTNQVRTTIQDGSAAAEHWIYRQKDIRSWWTYYHRSRPGGTRDSSPVGLSDGSGGTHGTWLQGDKRIAFSELGAPAIDKATNQPNVFYDPKSSESHVPYFSSSDKDEYIQRLYYEVMIKYWRDGTDHFPRTMIDPEDMYAWTWDARPYPAFPHRADIWSDAPNYPRGHWLNGRVGVAPLGLVVQRICAYGGLTADDIDVSGLVNSSALIKGYVVESLSSPRDMLAPLMQAYLFDGYETGGKIKFVLRSSTTFMDIDEDDLVVMGADNGDYSITRAQESELPTDATVTYLDQNKDYQFGSVGGGQTIGSAADNTINQRLPMVLDEEYARSLGDVMVHQAWAGRERGEFVLPPSYLALDPSDGVKIALENRTIKHVVGRIDRGSELTLNTASHDPKIFEGLTIGIGTTAFPIDQVAVFGPSQMLIMDLPILQAEGETSPWAPRLIAYQSPAPSAVSVYLDEGDEELRLHSQVSPVGIIGETRADLNRSDPWRFDSDNELSILLYNPDADLTDATKLEVLRGENSIAVETSSGYWEIIQFTTKTFDGSLGSTELPLYTLSGLLRGQYGTEAIMDDTLLAGARVALLTREAIAVLNIPYAQRTIELDFRYGPAGVDYTSELYKEVSHTSKFAGLLPYAPHAIKKAPTASSTEVTFSWIRRTRFGGDDFEESYTPLNEDSELYDLEIYDETGVTLLREASQLTSSSYVYTEAEQAADGGALDRYLVRVWQISTQVGRGHKAEKVV